MASADLLWEFNALSIVLGVVHGEKKYCIIKNEAVHTEKIQSFRVAWQVRTPHNPLQKRLQKTLGEAKG